MNPQIIIPSPDALPLPAPVFVLRLLLQLTFLLHLVAMNAMLGGLLITLYGRVRGTGADDSWTRLATTIAKVTPSLVAATVTLGVAPLLFLQVLYGQYFFTSSILMGWGWFSVFLVLIFAYYGTYLQSFKGEALGGARNPLLGLTLLLVLWVGFMISNNTSLMLQPQHWAALYFADARGLHLNLGDPQLAPRFLHMVLGALAVSGLMLAWWGRSRQGRGDTSGTFMVSRGLAVFSWATAINVVLGLWYFLAQPSLVRKLFMGYQMSATAMFGLGFALTVVMVVVGFTLGKRGPEVNLWPLSILTVVQLITMIMMRDVVRGGHLGVHFQPATFAVRTQGLNLGIFAVLLVSGVGVMVWMLRQLFIAWER